MTLSPSRFVTFEGTEVRVSVNSSAEAKTALKELSHKKKELAHVKRGLLRQQKAHSRRQAKASQPRSFVWQIFDPRKTLVRVVTAVVDAVRPRKPPRDTDEIARELKRIDEISHNIYSCRLQIEGKLIHLG